MFNCSMRVVACGSCGHDALCSCVPPGDLPSSLHARCQCLGPAHDHACSCACGCTGRGAMMELPVAKTAMRTRRESTPPGPLLFLRPFTFISRLTCHNKHTHADTYREDIQRFQWRSPWLQWRSHRPTTTTTGSSPRITYSGHPRKGEGPLGGVHE